MGGDERETVNRRVLMVESNQLRSSIGISIEYIEKERVGRRAMAGNSRTRSSTNLSTE